MPRVRYTIDFELDLYFLLLVINRSLIFIIVVVLYFRKLKVLESWTALRIWFHRKQMCCAVVKDTPSMQKKLSLVI